jgi:hypothetical protein
MGLSKREQVENEAVIEALFDGLEVGLNALREENERLIEAVKKLEAAADKYDGFIKDGKAI